MTSQPVSPSVARIATIARALGDLSKDVVFIGGAIAPLLQTHPAIPRVRATKDVDAVVASTDYTTHQSLETKLSERGFTRNIADATHVHRWRAPDGTPFDLVPAGDHLGGTGNEWDRMALETSVETEVEVGLTIRHASAPGFLALKWAAFRDRGERDPFVSQDLEDILALVVSRDTIVSEFEAAPPNIKEHVRSGFRRFKADGNYGDLVAAHLGHAQSFKSVAATLQQRIEQMLAM